VSLKKRTRKPLRKVSKPVVTFQDVAQNFVGSNAPKWFAPFLDWLSQSILFDRIFQKHQPTRTVMRKRLRAVIEAVTIVRRSLGSPYDCPFLLLGTQNWAVSSLDSALKDLSERAAVAADLPCFSRSDGTIARGRGKTTVPGGLSPKELCALRTAEIWKFFHGRYPGSRNPSAAGAAEAYWVASGGNWTRGEDPIESWRPHFIAARSNGVLLTQLRTLLNIDIRQAESSGRSSWFVGYQNRRKER
jgi:hypothetical protein